MDPARLVAPWCEHSQAADSQQTAPDSQASSAVVTALRLEVAAAKKKHAEDVKRLEEKVASANATTMQFHRDIRALDGQLAVEKARSIELQKTIVDLKDKLGHYEDNPDSLRVQAALMQCNRCWEKGGDWTRKMGLRKGFGALKDSSKSALVRRQILYLWRAEACIAGSAKDMDEMTAWGLSKHCLQHTGNWSRGVRQGWIGDTIDNEDADEAAAEEEAAGRPGFLPKLSGRRPWWDAFNVVQKVQGLAARLRKHFTAEIKHDMSVEAFQQWLFEHHVPNSLLNDFRKLLPSGCFHSQRQIQKQRKADKEEAHECLGTPTPVFMWQPNKKGAKKVRIEAEHSDHEEDSDGEPGVCILCV